MNILCVDDDDIVRFLLSKMLKKLGHTPILACNGREGLNFLTTMHDKIDIVILDIEMPILNGYDFLKNLSVDSTSYLPKILIHSTHKKEDIIKKLIDNNIPNNYVAGILSKVVSVDEFSSHMAYC